jgi:hypothetical protein
LRHNIGGKLESFRSPGMFLHAGGKIGDQPVFLGHLGKTGSFLDLHVSPAAYDEPVFLPESARVHLVVPLAAIRNRGWSISLAPSIDMGGMGC